MPRGGSLAGRRTGIAVVVAAVGLTVPAAVLGGASAGPALGAGSQAQPNIILVRTDDQTAASLDRRFMPHATRLLSDRGTTFTQFELSSPQCCPSRAGYLTGQYGHNNGVLSNSDAYGSLVNPANVLPVWLRRAGYVTAHLGKWMDGYARAVGNRNAVAPGWSHWFTVQGLRYYDYTVSVDGRKQFHGDKPRDYITRVLHHRAAALIRKYADGPRPLYLQLDERAPHDQRGLVSRGRCDTGVPIPDPRDAHRYPHKPLPSPPSFNERSVADKPSFVRDLPRLDRPTIREMKREYRCGLEALRGVDRGIHHMVGALRAAGALDRTVLIFTSDNGFFNGEHRIRSGKVIPYEEATRVPLVMRIPTAYRDGAPRTPRISQPVSNIDLAPTILDLAGAQPCNDGGCRVMDGRSLLGLVSGRPNGFPQGRSLLSEYSGEPVNQVCDYGAVHERRRVYVDYRAVQGRPGECVNTSQREFYDLTADPFELRNLYPAPPGDPEAIYQELLQTQLQRLETCAGIQGRDPRQGTRPFCE